MLCFCKKHIWPLLPFYLKNLGSFENLDLILGGELLKEKKQEKVNEWEGKIWTLPASVVKRKITQQLPIPLKYVSNNHPMFEVNANPKILRWMFINSMWMRFGEWSVRKKNYTFNNSPSADRDANHIFKHLDLGSSSFSSTLIWEANWGNSWTLDLAQSAAAHTMQRWHPKTNVSQFFSRLLLWAESSQSQILLLGFLKEKVGSSSP